MGHSMLLGAVVPMKYWTYAIQYALYIYNRFPTTTEDGYMAPYEVKYGVSPDVGDMKTLVLLAAFAIPTSCAVARKSTKHSCRTRVYLTGHIHKVLI